MGLPASVRMPPSAPRLSGVGSSHCGLSTFLPWKEKLPGPWGGALVRSKLLPRRAPAMSGENNPHPHPPCAWRHAGGGGGGGGFRSWVGKWYTQILQLPLPPCALRCSWGGSWAPHPATKIFQGPPPLGDGVQGGGVYHG